MADYVPGAVRSGIHDLEDTSFGVLRMRVRLDVVEKVSAERMWQVALRDPGGLCSSLTQLSSSAGGGRTPPRREETLRKKCRRRWEPTSA